MKKALFMLLLLQTSQFLFAQRFMIQPVDGQQGKDYIIVNYVDWRDTGILDAYCGSKTYDGHQGTDYTLRSFSHMDSSIGVLAAAKGVVTFVQDDLFDRETEGDVSKRLGNYIAIRHENKFYTYYAHLKTNSATVNVGDTVEQGQRIGAIGSSGNSTDPHLHFEVWYDSLYVVDPFKGDCGNSNTLFLKEDVYDTSLHVWDVGMHDSLVDLNAMRERIVTKSKPYIFPVNATTPVVFWSHLSGLKKGDNLTIRWLTPSKTEWFKYAVDLEKDWWYYYYFTYINNVNLPVGNWEAVLDLNGVPIVSQNFTVDDKVNVVGNTTEQECRFTSVQEVFENPDITSIKLMNINGQTIALNAQSIPTLEPGFYLLETVTHNDKRCIQKFVVE